MTVNKQIAFITSCLEGKAHEWLDPFLEQDVILGNPVAWLHDLSQFWTEFNTRWNAQNKKENNQGKLQALSQTHGVQEYHKDFQTYSQGLGYNDASLRDMFYDGLAVEIKKMMVSQDYNHTSVYTINLWPKHSKSIPALMHSKCKIRLHLPILAQVPRVETSRQQLPWERLGISCLLGTMFTNLRTIKR